MADVTLPIPFVQQETDFLCGPAVLQMVLSGLGVQQPQGPDSWQQHLWRDVKAQTRARRPKAAKTAGGGGNQGCPGFTKQKCERCPALPDFKCWCSTPQAISRVMNLRGGGSPVAVTRSSDEEDATALIVASIDAQVAAVALVFGWLHWVVVRGYEENGVDPTRPPFPTPIGGKTLNGLYIRDPQRDEQVSLISMQLWFDDYLSSVPCGAFMNDYVVVCAKPSRKAKAKKRKPAKKKSAKKKSAKKKS